jgi:uncharacterized protein YbbC (DUF1343 family)
MLYDVDRAQVLVYWVQELDVRGARQSTFPSVMMVESRMAVEMEKKVMVMSKMKEMGDDTIYGVKGQPSNNMPEQWGGVRTNKSSWCSELFN